MKPRAKDRDGASAVASVDGSLTAKSIRPRRQMAARQKLADHLDAAGSRITAAMSYV
jgi:hypothetical protein